MNLFMCRNMKHAGGINCYMDAAAARGHKLVVRNTGVPHVNDAGIEYAACHPESVPFVKSGAYESGFWHCAAHIDSCDLWAKSALTKPGAVDQINSFVAPVSAKEVVFSHLRVQSKYAQRPFDHHKWTGIVLAGQIPFDRSIQMIGDPYGMDDYWDFVEKACAKYKSELLIKLHPLGTDSIKYKTRDIAQKYGCAYGDFGHSVLLDCKFCLLYCSSFSVDCFMRDTPVVQYAPGYFHNTGAVNYFGRRLPEPDEVIDRQAEADKLINFLIWRYCHSMRADPTITIQILEAYATSNDLFPLPEELSYANSVLTNAKQFL